MTTAPRILAGFDGSEHARHAVRWAAAAADARRWPLTILTALPQSVDLALPSAMAHQAVLVDEGPSREELEALCAELGASHPGLQIRSCLVQEGAVDALRRASGEAGFVVVGACGLGALPSMILGSVSDVLATHARGPVVVVPEREGDPAGPIVAGFAGADCSTAAIDFAAVQANLLHAPLHVVTAWVFAHPAPAGMGLMGSHLEQEPAIMEALGEELRQATAHLSERYPQLDLRLEVVRDAPVELLVSRSSTARLLVVGSRGRGGFTGMLLGSTSRRVLQRSHCPAVVVPHPAESDED